MAIFTHRWVLNNQNTWIQGGEHYTLGSVEGNGDGQWGWGVGGKMPNVGEGEEGQQNTLPCVYLCNCLACSAHVSQNLKSNKKLKKKKKKMAGPSGLHL